VIVQYLLANSTSEHIAARPGATFHSVQYSTAQSRMHYCSRRRQRCCRAPRPNIAQSRPHKPPGTATTAAPSPRLQRLGDASTPCPHAAIYRVSMFTTNWHRTTTDEEKRIQTCENGSMDAAAESVMHRTRLRVLQHT